MEPAHGECLAAEFFEGFSDHDTIAVDNLVAEQFPAVVEGDQPSDLGMASSDEERYANLYLGASGYVSHPCFLSYSPAQRSREVGSITVVTSSIIRCLGAPPTGTFHLPIDQIGTIAVFGLSSAVGVLRPLRS
ncbi:hypothetical protein KV112_08940 [Mycolicibacter sp. MYC123]|uniref:Uncharacterized protein n=2 Tax=Mycolicibacter TaxID=1073531 RepID=A0ABU5YIJ6_9MYCO|nr:MULTISPECIES: hypothetical protein [unclassified Mycolicibacter]MEB3049858.1 hypothetical protein [Mycolicibacter sp. MYC123]MEB3062237.1 hypothetical protein [Mycolicibacter sp. MYC101]MEB3072022.1 hypothetical protein [Mycolicibacter sp. MYC017]